MSVHIDVYTDGATSGNGTKNARGGWAYMFEELDGEVVCGYGGELDTTNNRMELIAALKGLEAARAVYGEETIIHIISDSAYLINCYEQKWYKNWKNNGWINSAKKPVANKDLWEKLIPYFEDYRYMFSKCAGHSGNKNNDLVDKLAKRGATEVKKGNECLYN